MISEEEERQPEGADSALPEYLPRQARSTRGNPKYTYSDDDDDEYSSSDNVSVEETPPFKSNDTIYPTAYAEQTVNCMLISFLKEVNALVPRPSLTWTMEGVSFIATFASGKKFTSEMDDAL
ncbi:unnamed protein product [Aspergillus oryzae]|uniref:Unnamed protein product n=1 Tax=Aspergillus oryzae var. brunneus TaxID=332754 RepID=A0ABQ6KT44_ASPOZ|nr:unnamed protein product [Aspergillus oryzae]GMF96308.1 unnamed protein product [Aspergillus oryzae]GMG16650.1 unnamed protein product [Aspergillus oryzae]GMG48342.1 unnamed protein product [Aspergillus oryzae var. brunneus]